MVALVFVGIMTPKQHCGSIYFISQIIFAKCITTALVVLLRLVSTEWGCS